jgi:XTP/dITP diphosphohydrolase
VFVPAGYELSFGELERADKHRISHRADAFAKLVADQFGG